MARNSAKCAAIGTRGRGGQLLIMVRRLACKSQHNGCPTVLAAVESPAPKSLACT